MSALIPDPIEPEKGAIDEHGKLLGSVFFAPIGADPLDKDAWTHIGYGDLTPPEPNAQDSAERKTR